MVILNYTEWDLKTKVGWKTLFRCVVSLLIIGKRFLKYTFIATFKKKGV